MVKSAKDKVSEILTDIIEDPIKKRFFTILNDKDFKRERYTNEKVGIVIKKGDIVNLVDGRRAKIVKHVSNSAIHIQLFNEDGSFSETIDIIAKLDIEKVEKNEE